MDSPKSPPSKPLNPHNNSTMDPSPTINLTPSPSPSPSPSSSSKRKTLTSPSPNHRKPKPRLLPITDPLNRCPTPRRNAKRPSPTAAAAASPRKKPRARRRLEKEIAIREENELFSIEDGAVSRPKKRRPNSKQQKDKVLDEEKLCLVASCSIPNNGIYELERDGDYNVWEFISELVMWKNVAKSTLWFGSGSILFLSSCFSRDSNFSIISAASHLGILILGIAFFRDSLPRQWPKPRETKFRLTEEDLIRAARLVLPMANAVLAEYQKIFSGEPLMTLKAAPVLLLTAKVGHLITPWNLLATGFYLSFTLPKLCSSYSGMIQQHVAEAKTFVKEAWESCPRKKLFATSAAMLLWNMFSLKMRVFAAFMSVVVFRHNKQQHARNLGNDIKGVAENSGN